MPSSSRRARQNRLSRGCGLSFFPRELEPSRAPPSATRRGRAACGTYAHWLADRRPRGSRAKEILKTPGTVGYPRSGHRPERSRPRKNSRLWSRRGSNRKCAGCPHRYSAPIRRRRQWPIVENLRRGRLEFPAASGVRSSQSIPTLPFRREPGVVSRWQQILVSFCTSATTHHRIQFNECWYDSRAALDALKKSNRRCQNQMDLRPDRWHACAEGYGSLHSLAAGVVHICTRCDLAIGRTGRFDRDANEYACVAMRRRGRRAHRAGILQAQARSSSARWRALAIGS